MSKETLDQFIQKVTDSEQLQARIGEEIDIESLIALGAEHGYEFTAEDLAQNVELSDEELDGVAGGGSSDALIYEDDGFVDGNDDQLRYILDGDRYFVKKTTGMGLPRK